ncbi:MAG: helix-turn-helix domain-containing protein [Clostridia bacterium]|nr:helix-turn-helix domain-containing protein [Clostridia bacterium]
MKTNVVFNLAMFKDEKLIKRVSAEGYESLLCHSHDFVETVYVLEGEARHFLGKEEQKVKKGDFLIIQPGVEHYYVPKYGNANFQIENFIFAPDVFPFLKDYPSMVVQHVNQDAAVTGLIAVLEAECANRAKSNDEMIRHEMYALLLNIVMRYSDRSIKDTEVSRNLCEEICNYIKQNYSEEISLDKLARAFYCSKNTIVSLFKRNYSTTVYHYILKVRIEKACELLLKSNLSNHAISEAVGFSDFRNFYRHFKSIVGLTPKAYKEQAEKEDVTHD